MRLKENKGMSLIVLTIILIILIVAAVGVIVYMQSNPANVIKKLMCGEQSNVQNENKELEDKLQKALTKIVDPNNTLTKMDKENNTITILGNNVVIKYNLVNNPIFTMEFEFNNQMSKEECEKEHKKIAMLINMFQLILDNYQISEDSSLNYFVAKTQNANEQVKKLLNNQSIQFNNSIDYAKAVFYNEIKFEDELFSINSKKVAVTGQSYKAKVDLEINMDGDFSKVESVSSKYEEERNESFWQGVEGANKNQQEQLDKEQNKLEDFEQYLEDKYTNNTGNNFDVSKEDKIIRKVELAKYEDITIEAAYIGENERILIYTRKDKDNKIIWTYKTGTEIEAQYSGIQTSKITKDRIYIDEYGTITVLNKETGKTIWKWKYCEADDVVELAYVEYIDELKNTYVTYGKSLTILDKDGKVKSTTTYDNIDLTDSHCSFTYISKTEGIVLGNETFALVNLSDYSTKLTGEIFNDSWCDEKEKVKATVLRNEGTDGLLLTGYVEEEEKWAYRTNMFEWAQCDSFKVLEITNDRVYLDENGSILVFNKENGKIIWKNLDAKEDVIDSHYLDKEQNLYIYYGEQVNVIDKEGKTKAVIKHECLGGLVGEGIEFNFINEKELVLEAMAGRVTVNLEDYSIKEAIEKEM